MTTARKGTSMFGLQLRKTSGIALILACALSVGSVQAEPSALSQEPVVIQKASQVISDQTRTILSSRNPYVAKCWVFFTDKGVFDSRAFQRQAAAVEINEHAMTRRAKVGMNRVLFVDLPVVATYVHQIENLGGQLRYESRYLNAASFEIPMDALNTVAALPFVAEIQPIAEYIRPPEPTEDRPPSTGAASGTNDLPYGSSYTQLNLMKVPTVHNKGYNGSGVTLAVFDTGFRKSHQAFANAYAEHRVLGEYDFIFHDSNTANEAVDVSNQWSHGTSTWSLAGGQYSGQLYGAAYKANFLLCKTEDVRSETHVEEDNWVAALEWSDARGVDVVTSSLGYRTFDAGQTSYTYADMNGATAICTKAANKADSLGIIVCNSMGNDGPSAGTLSAPADAFGILAVGAVYSNGTIAGFSSRGPTYDGRTKPEICAMGVSTYAASSNGDAAYNNAFSGTSAACPMAAGAVCLLVQAHPDWPPALIRQAIMATASNATAPNNTYGWGIVNIDSAMTWGVNFATDTHIGPAPLTVQFTNSSQIASTSLLWNFGDGQTSTLPNPSHQYSTPGHFTVTLTLQTEYGPMSAQKPDYVAVTADTLRFGNDSVFAGHQGIKSITLTNTQLLTELTVPFRVAASPLRITVDSITLGARTSYFDVLSFQLFDPVNNQYVCRLIANSGTSNPPLAEGSGEILKVYWTTHPYDLGDLQNSIDTATLVSQHLGLVSTGLTYVPTSFTGTMSTRHILRCDLTGNLFIDLSDLSALISYLTGGGFAPTTVQSGDFNADYIVDLSDLSSLVSYLTTGAPYPVNP
ncbi:hypothetical protein C3F09_12145 [candidate division GN15 bacterium]|uniref:PKD domain-containing protein n=1 Tax=candidate division GN15 bacterium TaxID=2072418 RepID=A0A855X3D2_9BACT|nr:MAG: hypothetical protein C3F09_12145 [candidate division GN15 bacterium]